MMLCMCDSQWWMLNLFQVFETSVMKEVFPCVHMLKVVSTHHF